MKTKLSCSVEMALRVAVIGAGAGGLCALHHLAARPTVFTPVGYELSMQVAGTWVYNDRVGEDEMGHPIYSTMYKNLRTNLPKEAMAFPDFPFSKRLPSFMPHQDVRRYLEDYADQFNLLHYIQFQTSVECVDPKCESDGRITWQVTTRNHQMDPPADSTEEFDAVIVCNGQYSVPLIPILPGMSDFKGRVLHSHDYRDPAEFVGKTVVCLGAGASGVDISLDLLSHATRVYLCHNLSPLQSSLPSDLHQKPGVHRVHANSVELVGGETLPVDVLLFCTGHRYTYPFMSPACGLVVDEDQRVRPLWKHLIHPNLPTLSLIGVPKKTCSFPLYDCQVQLVVRVLAGDVLLPSATVMLADEQTEYEERLQSGMPPRYAHTMGPRQWAYNDDLANIGGFPPIPPIVAKLCNYNHKKRFENLPGYKQRRYEVTGYDTFIDHTETSEHDA